MILIAPLATPFTLAKAAWISTLIFSKVFVACTP